MLNHTCGRGDVQHDESSSDSTRKSCLNSPWSRLNYLSSPLQKVMPWKFTYNVTCSFLTNKRQEKGEQEKQQSQSPEFQKRRLEEGICFTGSPWEHPKKWYLCYGRNSKFGRTRAWGLWLNLWSLRSGERLQPEPMEHLKSCYHFSTPSFLN